MLRNDSLEDFKHTNQINIPNQRNLIKLHNMAATIDHTASMTQDSINEEEEFEGESQAEGDVESQRDLYLPSTPSDVSTENEIKEQKLIGSDALKNQR